MAHPSHLITGETKKAQKTNRKRPVNAVRHKSLKATNPSSQMEWRHTGCIPAIDINRYALTNQLQAVDTARLRTAVHHRSTQFVSGRKRTLEKAWRLLLWMKRRQRYTNVNQFVSHSIVRDGHNLDVSVDEYILRMIKAIAQNDTFISFHITVT